MLEYIISMMPFLAFVVAMIGYHCNYEMLVVGIIGVILSLAVEFIYFVKQSESFYRSLHEED